MTGTGHTGIIPAAAGTTSPAISRYRLPILFCLLTLFSTLTVSQRKSSFPSTEKIAIGEEAHRSSRHYTTASAASQWIDIVYYRLNLVIQAASPVVRGSVTATGRSAVQAPREISYDLAGNMTVDSASVAGVIAPFSQQNESVTIQIDSTVEAGALITTVIYYHGNPSATGLGSFVNTTADGGPWIWSLSEPYGARDWWPCKDSPIDKADSADIVITTDSTLLVGSNGILAGRLANGDGTATWHWKERYPIATYLISVAIGRYEQFSLWYHSTPTDSLQILNYVLPESLASARTGLAKAVDGLSLFSRLFGPYPFGNEKYGHSQFGGYAMEHQTMTSTETFDEETIIHELAHQWFGDMITCRSWRDVWLNEGFATYCTALYFGSAYGDSAYRDYIGIHLSRARTAIGPIYAADTTGVRPLFSGARTYSKGAAALHMLRHVIGDTLFFRALSAYAHAPALRYSSASTADFESLVEQTVHGDLGYFFREWIYGENYPHYRYHWTTAGASNGMFRCSLTLSQTTGTDNPPFFTMPVDCHLSGPDGDSTVILDNNASPQTFVFSLPFKPTSLRLDENNWILKDVLELQPALPVSGISLQPNFPNPFSTSTTFRYSLSRSSYVQIDVYNLLGRKVASLFQGNRPPGDYESIWTPAGLPGGVYFCRLAAGGVNRIQATVLIR